MEKEEIGFTSRIGKTSKRINKEHICEGPECNLVHKLLDRAGLKMNGENLDDINVYHPALCKRILRGGSVGVGESFIEKWWDCEHLDKFFIKLFRVQMEKTLPPAGSLSLPELLLGIKSILINCQSKSRAFVVGNKHYDIGNDLYERMLDKRMVYTCAYWKDAGNLDDAQEAKLDLVCRKLKLKAGMSVLDIGCGWGSFAKFAAENYGVEVTGITVSKNQVELARELCDGLPVKILFQDYRDLEGEFDRIVSLGMFEHVGYKNYGVYMKTVHRCLRKDGLFLLHTIGNNHSGKAIDPWINKYIFPNAMIPSIEQIAKAAENYFIMEDWHNFGADYEKTLKAWYANFEAAWPDIRKNYSDKFYRMWKYYLLSCAALFGSRRMQLWQIVFSKTGVLKGYDFVRFRGIQKENERC